eukprot:scaffold7944_cov131-Isochrysis_galbana.AAC.6
MPQASCCGRASAVGRPASDPRSCCDQVQQGALSQSVRCAGAPKMLATYMCVCLREPRHERKVCESEHGSRAAQTTHVRRKGRAKPH